MKKFVILLTTICVLFNSFSTVYADNEAKLSWPENTPNITSEAAIVMEASTGAILYEKNIHKTYYPASITKILTTLIALENSSLGEIVTHSKNAIYDVELDSSRIGIDVGEELTMEQSLYGIMLESANEVSYAVAEHVSGDVESFVKLMNEKAKSLGAVDSNFVNPHGLPDPNHYTSAYDMALISRAALENEAFRKITKTRTYTIPPTNIQEETRYLANHHRFIKNSNSYEGAIGGKTGYTSKAKYTLATFAERNGMTLICVVMRSESIQSEYEDTTNLLNYGFDNFSIHKISDVEGGKEDLSLEDSSLFTKYSPLFSDSETRLQVDPSSNIILPIHASFSDTEKEIVLTPLTELTDGINILGNIKYSYNGTYIGSANVTYDFSKNTDLLEGSYVPIPTITEQTANSEHQKSNESTYNVKAIIIGIIVCILVLIVGLYIVFIELPYIRRRKSYMQKRNKKKGTSIDF